MTRVIAILNQKGGVGKTTTAINLGACLAALGKSVLLVDFDPQGNATSGLGHAKNSMEATVYDLLMDDKITTDTLIYPTSVQGLSIIPANAGLASAEVDLVQKPDREEQLKRVLHGLTYDYILIDCPPSLSLLTVNALTAANHLLIPVQAEYYALEGLGQLLQVVQRVRAGLNAKLEILGVVVTMHSPRTTLSQQVVEELQKHFGEKLFKTFIPRNVRLAEAPSFGKPITEHDKWSKGARAYKQLAKELTKRVEK